MAVSVICMFWGAPLMAFDVKGLQPIQPDGVFSTFSTRPRATGTLSYAIEVEKSIDPDFYRLSSAFSYGPAENFELDMTIPYRMDSDEAGAGFEDISLGLKHRFIKENTYTPELAYLLTYSPSIGKEEISMDGRYGIGIITSKKIGPFMTHLNIFYHDTENSDLHEELDLRLGFDLSATHNLNLLGEVLIKNSHFTSNVDSIEGRIGYRYRPADFLYTNFGLGYDFKNRSPELRLFLSFTFTYPEKKAEVKRIYEQEE